MIKGAVAMFWFFVAFLAVFVIYLLQARKGATLHMRRVTGLDAIDEAIGRCTEMGRPVHYTFGIGELDSSILASFDVLSYVASKCAQMNTDIIVTNAKPEVHPMTEEIVRAAYVHQGRPDAYKPDNIRFLSAEQTAYAAAIYGIFTREKPAANLMIGAFFGESLMIAEVGNQSGAIQIGGTGRQSQISFFVATCDYTLIGDELFAAGAYISRQPHQIGSIFAQDFGKWATLVLVLVATIMNTLGNKTLTTLLGK